MCVVATLQSNEQFIRMHCNIRVVLHRALSLFSFTALPLLLTSTPLDFKKSDGSCIWSHLQPPQCNMQQAIMYRHSDCADCSLQQQQLLAEGAQSGSCVGSTLAFALMSV